MVTKPTAMLTADQVRKLISDNELLQVQLADVNEVLAIREEELELLRARSGKMVELQSTLDNNLEEFSYMQHVIGKHQVNAEKASRREAEMEKELLEGIRMEKEYYSIRDKYNSTSTALLDVNQQLSEIPLMNRDLEVANRKISELESRLDILQEEKELLQYEVSKLKKQNEVLKSGLGT
ncbi:MAG: hypothetical protein EOO01_09220 [Chitinophagaceae bacterium]|nr:MAG: hypothetical protein EOO01_09220 [Chitinophagaceae bacterium]